MYKIILLIFISLAACSPEIRVHTDYDKDYNVRDYIRFHWAPQKDIESKNNPLYNNELNDKRIKNAVNNELRNKGYELTEENPDLILHYHIVIEDMSEVVIDPYNYHYGPHWPRSRSHIYKYREGTLIIDLMDPQDKNLIWRGWATSALDEIYKAEMVEPLIQAAVSKIFRKFPSHTALPTNSQSQVP